MLKYILNILFLEDIFRYFLNVTTFEFLLLLSFGSVHQSHQFTEKNTTLILVQTIIRHGDRAPVAVYPTDPNTIDSWPEGLGKLTLTGKKQHYALGKFLRSMYQGFITSNPNEVLVNSSESERCLSGASATLASFYAPQAQFQIEDGLPWQPIPIHYFPFQQDKFLSFKGTCPWVKEEQIRQLNSERMQELYQKHQAELSYLSDCSGLNVSQGLNALLLHDILRVEKLHNLTIPEWADVYWQELEEVTHESYRSVTSSPIILRLRAGPLLQDIKQIMKKKINGEIQNLKVQLYFTHDVNIVTLLLALNFTDMPPPLYCATLIFELHEMADASIAVRLLYLNSTDPLANMGEPHILTLDDCSEFCPLENFTRKFEDLIPENWNEECHLGSSADTNPSDIFRVFKNDN